MGSDNFFNFKFFLPFDQVQGQFWIVGAINFVFLVGRGLGSVEDIINAVPAAKQFQLKVDSSDGVNDFK